MRSSFDGYRVQLRIAGEDVMKTRKGLDWTAKFGAIAKAATGLPDAIVDGEIVALDSHGAPDFAFFAFDLLFDDDGDLRGSTAKANKS
jgi:bifunctional non-homologous end joining protein LigD